MLPMKQILSFKKKKGKKKILSWLSFGEFNVSSEPKPLYSKQEVEMLTAKIMYNALLALNFFRNFDKHISKQPFLSRI